MFDVCTMEMIVRDPYEPRMATQAECEAGTTRPIKEAAEPNELLLLCDEDGE